MRSLNLDQLRTLIEVAELGSFSAAARRLNLTQPAVSLHIRELERRFGVRLMERIGKQAHVTAPGLELLEAARRIFRECDGADAAMRRFREGWVGRVRISTSLTALMYQLPPILRQLRLEHPGIDLIVTNAPTRDSVEMVIANEIDLALVTLPIDATRLRVTPLQPDNLVAILPVGTPDVPDEITPDYVARQPLLMEHARGAVSSQVRRWLSGTMPRAPMHLATIEALKTAVAANLGMSIVPQVAVSGDTPDLLIRPLRPEVPCTLALIEHPGKLDEPALGIVRNQLLTLRAAGRAAPIQPSGQSRRSPQRKRRTRTNSDDYGTAQ